VTAERGPHGELTPGHKTEIRSRWSDKNLYLLFICKFDQLYSKPNPSTTSETNRLWGRAGEAGRGLLHDFMCKAPLGEGGA
jgi:hypothetical protein